MTIEEARAIWLLKIGSDWFFQMDLLVCDDAKLAEAFSVLVHTENSFDKDIYRGAIKIKCKS